MDMQIVMKAISELKPYEKNPRRNENAVEAVANSIKAFGFKVPVVIDGDGVIVCGHTRFKAAKRLGLAEVPCIVADDLTEEQIKAFRLADNKVGELATWDYELLNLELGDLEGLDFDMGDFGFYNNFDEYEFDHIFESETEESDEAEEEEDPGEEKRYKVVVHADSREEAKEIAEKLREQGYDCEVSG